MKKTFLRVSLHCANGTTRRGSEDPDLRSMVLRGAKLSCRLGLGCDTVQPGMWIRFVLFGSVLFALGDASPGRPSPVNEATANLQADINSLYSKSVGECAAFHAGDLNCIKTQFSLNYHWEILKDQSQFAGPPGTPGPTSGNHSGAASADTTQGSR